jgi:hypothetical protein
MGGGFVGSPVPGPVESVRSLEFLASTCGMKEPSLEAREAKPRSTPLTIKHEMYSVAFQTAKNSIANSK